MIHVGKQLVLSTSLITAWLLGAALACHQPLLVGFFVAMNLTLVRSWWKLHR